MRERDLCVLSQRGHLSTKQQAKGAVACHATTRLLFINTSSLPVPDPAMVNYYRMPCRVGRDAAKSERLLLFDRACTSPRPLNAAGKRAATSHFSRQTDLGEPQKTRSLL